MPRILVTGGSGLLGHRTVEHLVAEGHDVVVYDASPNEANLSAVLGKVTVVPADARDLPRLLATMKSHQIERVLHLAAFTAQSSEVSPAESVLANTQGLANALDAARTLDVQRVCWTSSIMAVGRDAAYAGRLVDEDYRYAPRTAYGIAKAACEVVAERYREAFELDVIGIRPPLAYGTGRLTGGTGAFNSALRDIALGRPATFWDTPDRMNQLVYNRDMAALLVAGTLVDRTEHALFNTPVLGPSSTEEIVAAMERVVPGCSVTPEPAGSWYEHPPLMDGGRATKELDFRPTWTLDDAFAEMVEHYRAEARS